ncbi:uncharacterized protein METZ01_LOCUS227237 [marine metagenome]|uniref:Phage tail collar domain-containing protein n=1 Tax=marine metagenome TaxID=408172 RepID=A0A382GIC3_9ZZZZ
MSGLIGSVGTKSGLVNEISAGKISGGVNFSELAGSIIPIGMATVPTGFLLCDGTAVSRTTYAVLFAAISTTWGAGDSSTTFNVPDLEGMFLRGTGSHGTGNMANGSDFAGPSLAAYENDQVQGHNHTFSQVLTQGGNGVYNSEIVSGQNGTTAINTNHPLNASAYSALTYGTPRMGDEARPCNTGVKYCIKY